MHLSFRCLRRFLVYLVCESCQPKAIVVHGTECHWLVSHGKVLLLIYWFSLFGNQFVLVTTRTLQRRQSFYFY